MQCWSKNIWNIWISEKSFIILTPPPPPSLFSQSSHSQFPPVLRMLNTHWKTGMPTFPPRGQGQLCCLGYGTIRIQTLTLLVIAQLISLFINFFLKMWIIYIPSSQGAQESIIPSLADFSIDSGRGMEWRTMAPYNPYSAITLLRPQHFSLFLHLARRFWNQTCGGVKALD